MNIFTKIFLLSLSVVAILSFPVQARADVFCFCAVDTAGDIKALQNVADPQCVNVNSASDCLDHSDPNLGTLKCSSDTNISNCNAKVENWKKQKAKALEDLAALESFDKKVESSKSSQILPACALADKLDLSGECGDITIFVKLMLDIVNYLLSFVGGLALIFCIYGGFVLIFSSGSPDKITQGKEILMSALIGLVVAFCGYVLVSFLGDAVGISSVYKLK